MAICKNCGKKGLFLKVNFDGLCTDCVSLNIRKQQEEQLINNLKILESKLQELQIKHDTIYNEIYKQATDNALKDIEFDLNQKNEKIVKLTQTILVNQLKLREQQQTYDKMETKINTYSRKLERIKIAFDSIQYAIDEYLDRDIFDGNILSSQYNEEIESLLYPTVELRLHCMDIKQLKQKYNENKKVIQDTLKKYEGRYTTKANVTIYKLMVIALEAELQNILYSINYGKVDKAINSVKETTKKYLNIAISGNQTISSTMTKFIGQIEALFINAVNIEYEYFIQKEKIKEEQRTLREQMRQEAAERKILEEQRKQVEREESKYKSEIQSLSIQLQSTKNEDTIKQLQDKIKELTYMLKQVEDKKDEIISLQNGKAGYVYIISNLGSFGDKIFKIGMTRRLNPQERVDELGDASVPFKFDVHSFIFSDDASKLETNLHKALHEQRVNKINNRKEFFYCTIGELEKLVLNLDPTAEFNKTMLAEQYYQTLSINEGLST